MHTIRRFSVPALQVLGTAIAALVLLGNTPPPRPTPPEVGDHPRWVKIQGNHGDESRWLTPGEILQLDSPLGEFDIVYAGEPKLDYSVEVEHLPATGPCAHARLIIKGRPVGLTIDHRSTVASHVNGRLVERTLIRS